MTKHKSNLNHQYHKLSIDLNVFVVQILYFLIRSLWKYLTKKFVCLVCESKTEKQAKKCFRNLRSFLQCPQKLHLNIYLRCHINKCSFNMFYAYSIFHKIKQELFIFCKRKFLPSIP